MSEQRGAREQERPGPMDCPQKPEQTKAEEQDRPHARFPAKGNGKPTKKREVSRPPTANQQNRILPQDAWPEREPALRQGWRRGRRDVRPRP